MVLLEESTGIRERPVRLDNDPLAGAGLVTTSFLVIAVWALAPV